MPSTMPAAVVRAFGQPLTIDELPVPQPGAGEILVKIEASGVCTREDLSEAIAFAAEGAVRANVTVEPLAAINDVFGRMERGQIEGRIVLRL